MRPSVRYLDDDTVRGVADDALRILEDVGVEVEFQPAVEVLHGAGAAVGDDGRIRIDSSLVEAALATTQPTFDLFDRDGGGSTRIGGGSVAFDPGSAAIRVFDYETGSLRPSTLDDCVSFAQLTEALPALALQSTCVVPSDVSIESGDRRRLEVALTHGSKPIITGTFHADSFDFMRRMLVCVRGSEDALRERPLAVFDCCPTSPLSWSELTCSALTGCARHGIPAELISVPLTGATAPVTFVNAVAQHAAENLSGVVIHQLIGPGAPISWGSCASGFDMRSGSAPLGAIESMMINSACAQMGKHFGLPTHAYMALSDSKTLDYQSGFESGQGAVLAALAGIDIVSGPGMLESAGTQSLEKLVLDHEACRAALRLLEGMERREGATSVDVIQEGLASGHFLTLQHTRDWFKKELMFPGKTVDRQVGEAWMAAGSTTAGERAHAEVERILAAAGPTTLAEDVLTELNALASAGLDA